MSKITKWFKNTKGFLVISIFIIVLVLIYWSIVRFQWNYGTWFKGFDNTDKQNFINIALFFGILFTFWEAYKFRKKTVEISERPCPVLFIRSISSSEYEKLNVYEQKWYVKVNTLKSDIQNVIVDSSAQVNTGKVVSEFYIILKVRNMGVGVAFNVTLEFDKGDIHIDQYSTMIYGPKDDEQGIKLIDSDGEKPAIDKLNNATVTINCESVSGQKYKNVFCIKDPVLKWIEHITAS